MSSNNVDTFGWELTNSQVAAKARLKDLLASKALRKIFILIGRFGSGKTFLAKRFLQKNDGAYCNLTETYLQEIFNMQSLSRITPEWMMRFLKKLVENYEQELVVVDGLESITMMLSKEWFSRFLKNLKTFYIPNKTVVLIFGFSATEGLTSLEDFKKCWGSDKMVLLEYSQDDAIIAAQNWGTSPSGNSLYDIVSKIYTGEET